MGGDPPSYMNPTIAHERKISVKMKAVNNFLNLDEQAQINSRHRKMTEV